MGGDGDNKIDENTDTRSRPPRCQHSSTAKERKKQASTDIIAAKNTVTEKKGASKKNDRAREPPSKKRPVEMLPVQQLVTNSNDSNGTDNSSIEMPRPERQQNIIPSKFPNDKPTYDTTTMQTIVDVRSVTFHTHTSAKKVKIANNKSTASGTSVDACVGKRECGFMVGCRVAVFVLDEITSSSSSSVRLPTGNWYSGTVTNTRKTVEVAIKKTNGEICYGVTPGRTFDDTEGANRSSGLQNTLASANIGASIDIPDGSHQKRCKGTVLSRQILDDFYVKFDDGDEWWANEKYDPIRLLQTRQSSQLKRRRQPHTWRSTYDVPPTERLPADKKVTDKLYGAFRNQSMLQRLVQSSPIDQRGADSARCKTAKKKTARQQRLQMKEKLTNSALNTMLLTTHVMVGKGATSQMTRCVIGRAATDVIRNKGAMRKERKKNSIRTKRLSALREVATIYEAASANRMLAGNFRRGEYDTSPYESEYVFCRGSKTHTPKISKRIKLTKGYKTTRWIDVEDSFKIIDSIEGCKTTTEQMILIPRHASTGQRMMGKDGDMQKTLFKMFGELEQRNIRSAIRKNGARRVMMPDGKDSNYLVIGTAPKRNGRGIRQCMKGLDEEDMQLYMMVFATWYRRVEHCANKYLPSHLRKLLKTVGEMCNHENMPLGNNHHSKVWPALAVGRNIFLNVHTDADYFWTLMSVVTDECPTTDSPIICYMCFPTLGIAVALRNGDLLLFNPLIPHCVSTRCDCTKEAYCVSMYMKSLLVGGSDNSKVLSEKDEEVAKFVLNNHTTYNE